MKPTEKYYKEYENYTNERLYEEEVNTLLLSKERREDYFNWLFCKYYNDTEEALNKKRGRY